MTGRGKGRQEAQYGLLTSIAGEAGVSLSTVSKVVHRRRDVGAATRARVEELLDRYGYVRPWERDPATPRQIIAVFRDLSGPYTLEVARGIVDAAGELGIDVVTGTTNRRSISGWLEECVALGAAGIVIVISMLSEEDQRRIVEQRLPVVLIDPLSAPTEDIPSIGVTNWSGAREAVQHLLGLGHTRIAMVAGRSHSLAGAARVHGYRAALEEAGIAYDPAIVRSTDFDYAEALTAGLQILRADAPPTAVFAASDAQALGVLEAARRQGLAVPDDLAVMSFDDTLVAAMACPPLSAVRQPFEELGREATRVLLELAQGRPPASPRIELATELVLRTSTSARRRLSVT
ncbi:LacI family DNA-binding transcriptional regulator [Streptomyces ipomoeae]|uniref:LacI family DNA-binding transcriptional regulator n=1 Tax=Streptomyces ipomoeae TaxID=103232 RepID=UPI00114637FA|nr:LacI family DNA-binding transcriptional regulator [Streptomyces ipomoeae]MDX2934473.1 LacI family DNA-binding transcriptional regulator [Streptomyces ipomoeae]TQE17401.1 LacI family transcriptional regulator [Streptomyces ipomoeae]